MTDLTALDIAVLDASPDDTPDIQAFADQIEAPRVEVEADQPAPEFEPAQNVSSGNMSKDMFLQQFSMLHDVLGGMVQMRTGTPCPIGSQARSEGGQAAADALYSICENNPALARLFLSTESTFIGQIAAIGMHGFACVQIVKTSIQTPIQSENELAQAA